MTNKIKLLLAIFSLIFIGTAYSGAYFSDSVEISDNYFMTAGLTITPTCQNYPGPDFCPANHRIVMTGTDENGCPIYSCQYQPPEIIITEILANPDKINDNRGEWFELYNNSDADINLKNWRYRDSGTGNWNIIQNDLVVGTKSYLVFIKNSNAAENGGIIGGYQMASNINLNNNSDELLIEKPDGNGGYTNVDTVSYDVSKGWLVTSGKSMKLNDLALDNDLLSSWSLSAIPYGLGDFGTPGGAND